MKSKIKLFNQILAFIYDVIIQVLLVLGTYLLFEHVLLDGVKNTYTKNAIIAVASIIILILYLAVIPIKLRGTIGKYMADLEVVATKGKFTFGRWLFREAVIKYGFIYIGVAVLLLFPKIKPLFFFIYIGIGFLIQLLFIIVRRKSIHDYLLKTKVITKDAVD